MSNCRFLFRRDAIYRVCKGIPNVQTPKLDNNDEGKDAINRICKDDHHSIDAINRVSTVCKSKKIIVFA